MLEALILIAIAAALLVVGLATARRATHGFRRGPTRASWVLALGLLAAATTSAGAYALMNARTVQVLGGSSRASRPTTLWWR